MKIWHLKLEEFWEFLWKTASLAKFASNTHLHHALFGYSERLTEKSITKSELPVILNIFARSLRSRKKNATSLSSGPALPFPYFCTRFVTNCWPPLTPLARRHLWIGHNSNNKLYFIKLFSNEIFSCKIFTWHSVFNGKFENPIFSDISG